MVLQTTQPDICVTTVRLLELCSPVFLLPMCCCSLHFKVFPAYFHIVCVVCFVFIFTGPLPGERRPPRLFQGSFWSIWLALRVRQLCLCRRRCAGRCLGRRAASLRRVSERASERAGPRSLLNYRRRVDPLCHTLPSMQGGLEQRRQTRRQKRRGGGVGGWVERKKDCFTCFCPGDSAALQRLCGIAHSHLGPSCTRVLVHCFGTGKWHIREQSTDMMGGGAVKVKHEWGTKGKDTDGGKGDVQGTI